MLEVAATEEVEVEEAAFLTPMVGQIIRLHHRLTEIMPLWVVMLRRLGTLRSHLAVGLRWTRAALEVAAAAAAASDQRPPNDSPRQSHGGPGHFGHYNIPHAIGWTVGTWAGATRRTVSSAFRSSQSDQQEEG